MLNYPIPEHYLDEESDDLTNAIVSAIVYDANHTEGVDGDVYVEGYAFEMAERIRRVLDSVK